MLLRAVGGMHTVEDISFAKCPLRNREGQENGFFAKRISTAAITISSLTSMGNASFSMTPKYTKHPKLHISRAKPSYTHDLLPFLSSSRLLYGAVHMGRTEFPSVRRMQLLLKSARTRCSGRRVRTKTLPGFMSLCAMPCPCAKKIADPICRTRCFINISDDTSLCSS